MVTTVERICALRHDLLGDITKRIVERITVEVVVLDISIASNPEGSHTMENLPHPDRQAPPCIPNKGPDPSEQQTQYIHRLPLYRQPVSLFTSSLSLTVSEVEGHGSDALRIVATRVVCTIGLLVQVNAASNLGFVILRIGFNPNRSPCFHLVAHVVIVWMKQEVRAVDCFATVIG